MKISFFLSANYFLTLECHIKYQCILLLSSVKNVGKLGEKSNHSKLEKKAQNGTYVQFIPIYELHFWSAFFFKLAYRSYSHDLTFPPTEEIIGTSFYLILLFYTLLQCNTIILIIWNHIIAGQTYKRFLFHCVVLARAAVFFSKLLRWL